MTLATRSRLSILLRAVRDDEDAAAQIGVRAFRVKLGAFVVASALTGVAGALQGLKLGAVEPYGTFGVHWTVTVLSIVVIGGQAGARVRCWARSSSSAWVSCSPTGRRCIWRSPARS